MILKISILLFVCLLVFCHNKHYKDGNVLNLSPLIENGEIYKARALSKADPEVFGGVQSHAAFINVNQAAKWNLFFWFFPVENKPLNTTPWIIWLQGGPGDSSLLGLFGEIGPLRLVDGKVEKMPVTWGSDYSLLFIDNPVGTGFSYSETDEYVEDIDSVGACLLNFIQQFLQVFPELREAPLFIAGESYAGKYIPAFGHYIHHRNDSLPINLKGLAIGNGWTDPPTLLHYSQWALQIGLVDLEQANELKILEDKALALWEEGNIEEYKSVAPSIYEILIKISKVNDYNFMKDYNDILWGNYEEFLNTEDIRKVLHVGNKSFCGSNRDVQTALKPDIYLTVKPWLEELLEYYGVMGYSGQLDVIVAYALSVNTYRNLQWSGHQAYLDALRKQIIDAKGHVIGYEKSAGNFMDVMVRNAGHMVPMDQPSAAKQIIDMFITRFSN